LLQNRPLPMTEREMRRVLKGDTHDGGRRKEPV
jgi:predicted transcriptional regulator